MMDHKAKAQNSLAVNSTCHPADATLPVLAPLICLTFPTEGKTGIYPKASPAQSPAEAKDF